jgi:hypothetical protein
MQSKQKQWNPFETLDRIKPPDDAILDPYKSEIPGMKVWKNHNNGFFIATTHFSADPKKRSEEWFLETTKNLRQDQIDREYFIDFQSRSGQKAFPYLIANKDKYLIDDIPLDRVPKHWQIIAGLDFGSVNPTSIHFYGYTEKKELISFFEFYKPSNVSEIALVLMGEHPSFRHNLYGRIRRVVADPSIFKKTQQNPMEATIESIADLLKKEGIHKLEPANNDRIAGLERLKMFHNEKPSDPSAKPKMMYCKRCKKQWAELVNITYKELTPSQLLDKNAHEDVVKKNDHCFVAGTMIHAERGYVPIEEITKEDRVLTRQGFMQVISAGMTGIKPTFHMVFSNGSEFRCTGNHPIFTENRGFVRADSLTSSDICISDALWERQKLLFSRDAFIADTQDQAKIAARNTLEAARIKMESHLIYIERFGSFILETFQAGIISIIKMGIRSIMIFPIWSACPQLNTISDMSMILLLEAPPRSPKKSGKTFRLFQKNGMDQKKEKFGTEITQDRHGRSKQGFKKYANFVRRNSLFSLLFRLMQNFVPQNVSPQREEGLEKTISMRNANPVGQSLPKAGFQEPKNAEEIAVKLSSRSPSSIEKVYNISVDGFHEYFANGILVHNSYDENRYVTMSVDAPPKEDVPEGYNQFTLAEVEKELDERFRNRDDDQDFF